ncbi:hypothetical protein [Nocardia nepalensis]|uniref:hypothetical protein n=1 Tax=Nocardia nepalensis TaxID=3375448 RepID=UPI003B67704E
MMRNLHTPLVGALALFAVLGAAVVVPTPAHSLATTAVEDAGGLCVTGAPTFDDIVTAAATALRTAVPGEQVAAFDRRVADFRGTIAAVRVHRDALPVAPSTVNERWTGPGVMQSMCAV